MIPKPAENLNNVNNNMNNPALVEMANNPSALKYY